jgi:hypothetical protein
MIKNATVQRAEKSPRKVLSATHGSAGQSRRRSLAALASLVLAALVSVVDTGAAEGSSSTQRAAAFRSNVAIVAPPRHGTRLLVFFAPFRPAPGKASHGLVVADRRGRVLRVLSTARSGTYALWSPDDSMIAWKDPAGIHVERADGSAPRLLVRARTSCVNCQTLDFIWAASAHSLTVARLGPSGAELRLVPVDGSAPKTLARSETTGIFYKPSFWTSDGRSLVYWVAGTTLAAPGAKINLLTLATGRTRTLWSTPNSHGGPSPPLISPDGRERAYITEVSQYQQRLSVADVATGATHIVRDVNPTNIVAWSPDSRSLAVAERGWHVVTVSARGRLLHRIGPGQQFSWSRDGELFILRANYNQVWVSHQGRPETYLFHLPDNAFVVSLAAN